MAVHGVEFDCNEPPAQKATSPDAEGPAEKAASPDAESEVQFPGRVKKAQATGEHVTNLSNVPTQLCTADGSSESAVEKCFANPEIFEAILGNLGGRKIFVARFVNNKWKAQIENSQTLQSRLYLPDEAALPGTWGSGTWGSFIDRRLISTLIWKTGHAYYARHPKPDSVWARREAFWRRLLLCSPPVTHASVRIQYFKNPRHEVRNVTCKNFSGVTLGDLWVVLMQTMGRSGYGRGGKRAELDNVQISVAMYGTYEWPGAAIDGDTPLI
ncbi:hypothetical protein LTR08_004496 [Meristemomyces frigidus]|nr:hypothetical protein LTR08_004496 [Meristemomyces frigidus]